MFPFGLLQFPRETPITIASLIAAGKISLHFDAAVGVTKDGGDKVSNWTNQGTGTDATQATGALQPTWYASQVNGLPAIGWNVAAAPSKMPGTMAVQTACTIILVMKQDTTHDGWIVELQPTNTTTNQGVDIKCKSGGTNAIEGITSEATKTSVNATWEVLSGSATNALRRIWIDQVLGTNNATGVTIGDCDNFQLGSDLQYGIYFDGMTAEIVVSNVELTDDERIAVEDELQAKYAL